MEELEEVLGIESYAMNWPIGMGKEFIGIYDRYNNRVEQARVEDESRFLALNEDGSLAEPHPMEETSYYKQALEDVLLLNEAGNDFDVDRIAKGDLTPVFFGSALTNFGVQTFLETFLKFAPPPQATYYKGQNRNRSVFERVFWVYFQNPSEYESRAP